MARPFAFAIRPRVVALTLAATPALGLSAASEASAFCPAGYALWGAICMSAATGDVVAPRTSGADYERIKTERTGAELCMAWDLHVTIQIEDFGAMPTFLPSRLARAGLLQAEARRLCREGRHEDAALVFESIFPFSDPD